MKMFLSLMIMYFSLMMFFFNNPISMGLMILIQSLLTCMISGMIIKTYWFSYILFLTFMGGLLVLFIYVSSIASNEMFKVSFFMNIFMFINMFLIMIMTIMFMNNLSWMNFNVNNLEMNKFFNLMFINNENKINLSKLYNNQTFLIMILLIIYLFITLIAIIKITNIFYGPLRSSFN